MQWEGKSACVQVSASNEEFQKMSAELERTAECRQKTLCPKGDGLEIHWALPAGVRIPSVSIAGVERSNGK